MASMNVGFHKNEGYPRRLACSARIDERVALHASRALTRVTASMKRARRQHAVVAHAIQHAKCQCLAAIPSKHKAHQ